MEKITWLEFTTPPLFIVIFIWWYLENDHRICYWKQFEIVLEESYIMGVLTEQVYKAILICFLLFCPSFHWR